jgi:hypothetical protein
LFQEFFNKFGKQFRPAGAHLRVGRALVPGATGLRWSSGQRKSVGLLSLTADEKGAAFKWRSNESAAGSRWRAQCKSRPVIARAALVALSVLTDPLREFRRGREEALFGPASDRSGMRPASTDDENNR